MSCCLAAGLIMSRKAFGWRLSRRLAVALVVIEFMSFAFLLHFHRDHINEILGQTAIAFQNAGKTMPKEIPRQICQSALSMGDVKRDGG
jgi:hypothetical protein